MQTVFLCDKRAWTTFTKTLGDWDVVLTPYLRDIDMNFIQHFLPGQPVEETAHQSIGLQSVAFTDLANGAQLAVGFDAEVTDGSLTQTQPNPTEGSFFLRNSIPIIHSSAGTTLFIFHCMKSAICPQRVCADGVNLGINCP